MLAIEPVGGFLGDKTRERLAREPKVADELRGTSAVSPTGP
jgi:hypothetical protein